MSDYPLSLVEKLSFVRYGGTFEEARAAQILLDDLASAGGHGDLMEFEIDAPVPQACEFAVCAPFERGVFALPYGLSGELDNAELDLYYAARGTAEDYFGRDDLSHTAVLLNMLTLDAYKELVKRHAAAFITLSGKYYDTPETASMYARDLRPRFREEGVIPGFAICASDATELLRDGAQRVRLTLRQGETKHVSRDVLAVIPGTECPNESIVLTAHYDSVPLGAGSWDNATGSAALCAIYRHFLQHPARRTLRFIWCGSEEQGLLGSKAYIAQHEELIDEIKFCFNFDMCGTILGPNHIVVTGGDDLKAFIEQFCHEVGYSAEFDVNVHSSDSAPFCDRGVPALGLSRETRTAEIHTRRDLLPPLGNPQMLENVDFAVKLIGRVANAAFVPIPCGMPDAMKEKLDKYFKRK